MKHEVTFTKQSYHLNGAMETWCADHIGKGGWIARDDHLWNIRSMFGNTTFAFKEEKHYTWFILRWSHEA